MYGDQPYARVLDLRVADWYDKQPIEGREHFLLNRIREVGIKRPLIVNNYPGREGIILDGVQIYCLAVYLKMEDVPVFFVEVAPEEEGGMHVFFNIHQSENSHEGLMRLTRMRYESYFQKNQADEEIIADYADVIEAGKKAMQKARPVPKPGKRIIATIPPEMSDYPELAMQRLGCTSINQLITAMLKSVVEGEEHA